MPSRVIKHNWLTIPLPEGWEDGSQIVVLGPRDGEFRPNCVFSREPRREAESASDFASRQLPQLKEALKSYEVVHESATRFGDNAGFLREHTFTMDSGAIAQLQFYVIVGESACTMTVTHRLGQLDTIKPIAERLFAQIRLDPTADQFP